MDKETARVKTFELVSRFQALEKQGKLLGMSEEDTKRAFIEPLFEILGWDVRNPEEVWENRAQVHGKRPDYAFRIEGVVRFYVEAKAAGADVAEKEAWQAINYSYNNSVPWAVLTNFRELAIYNSNWKSKKSEESRFLRFEFPEYSGNFDDLWLLSKESILAGEIEKKAQKYGRLAREPVTKALYSDLMRWRSLISKSVSRNDPRRKFTKELLDESVQHFLNRLIFIRTCEDRKIENEQLRAALRQWKEKNNRKLRSYVQEIVSEGFVDTYDSNIFFPHMAGEMPIEDEALAQVIEELYESPSGAQYDFDAIDADVLGNIYEQYLATVMREGGSLVEKEGKRKEMGIYYTPTYIVDYIVKNTLGELVARAKTADDLRKITVLDPACGSGSFLIRTFETLREEYSKKDGGDQQMLTENMSKNANDILTRNIHGVDLDVKAIEIAELNLLLRAAVRRGLLPPLSDNIKRGNSLISGTKEELEERFGPHWKEKHPFNWEEEFSSVMKNGGFDVVVGNPPYGANIEEKEKEHIKNKFKSATGRYDTYYYFIERGIRLLKNGGTLGFIVPDTWLTNHQTYNLREVILEECSISEIVSLPQDVFPDANVDTCIIIVKKETSKEKREKNVVSVKIMNKGADLKTLGQKVFENVFEVEQKIWKEDERKLFNIRRTGNVLVKKIENGCIKLGEITEMCRGINPYAKSELIEKHGASRGAEIVEKRIWHANQKKGDEYKKELVGGDVGRYSLNWTSGEWVKYGNWLSRPRDPKFFTLPHLVVQRIRNPKLKRRLIATYIDPKDEYYNNSGLTNIIAMPKYSINYTLALINSKLFNWYYSQHFNDVNIKPEDLRELPIKPLTESEQQPIINLVEQMLELNKKLVEMGGIQSVERQKLEAEILHTDEKIDGLVYKLYGITEEERKIIEESFNK